MNSDITFQLRKLHQDYYQILIKGAGFDMASSPQSASENIRELIVNYDFLKNRKLIKFFICEEPIFNIAYHGRQVEVFFYKLIDGLLQKTSMYYSQSFMLNSLNKLIEELVKDASLSKEEIFCIEQKISNEMIEGVYDIFV